jgi:hypothetical protein
LTSFLNVDDFAKAILLLADVGACAARNVISVSFGANKAERTVRFN